MNCKKCNAELEEGAIVCSACGEPVEQPQTAPEEVVETIPEVTEEVTPEAETAAAEVEPELEEETIEEDAAEEAVQPKKKLWKLLLTVGCCALLLAVLAIAILYGMGIPLGKRGEGIQYKASYTVSDENALKAKDKVVVTYGDAKMTNADLQAHYFNQVYQFLEEFGSNYFIYNQPLDSQICFTDTGTTWQQYFLENAINNWKRFVILQNLAEEEGYVADMSALDSMETALEEAAVSYGFENALALIQEDMGAGCTMDAYVDYVRLFRSGNQYVDYLFTKWEPTAEELDTFYNENIDAFIQNGIQKGSGMIADVRHILVIPEGEKVDGDYTEAQWAAALKEAEALLAEWKNGDATENSFAAMAAVHTDDTGSAATGGLFEDIIPGSNYVEEFLDWAIDENRVVGETGIVKTYYGYHIMFYVEGEEIWARVARENYLPEKLEAMIAENEDRWNLKIFYRKIVTTDANVG